MRAETRALIVSIFDDAVKVISMLQEKHNVTPDNTPLLFGSTALFYHLHVLGEIHMPRWLEDMLELRLRTSKKDIDVGYRSPISGMSRKQSIVVGSHSHFVDISFNHVELPPPHFIYDHVQKEGVALRIQNPLQLYCGRLLAFCERQKSSPILRIGDKKLTLDPNHKMLIDVELLEYAIAKRYVKQPGDELAQFLNVVWHDYYDFIRALREKQIQNLVQNTIRDMRSRYPSFTKRQIAQLSSAMQRDLQQKLMPEGRAVREFILEDLRVLAEGKTVSLHQI